MSASRPFISGSRLPFHEPFEWKHWRRSKRKVCRIASFNRRALIININIRCMSEAVHEGSECTNAFFRFHPKYLHRLIAWYLRFCARVIGSRKSFPCPPFFLGARQIITKLVCSVDIVFLDDTTFLLLSFLSYFSKVCFMKCLTFSYEITFVCLNLQEYYVFFSPSSSENFV